MNLGEDDRQIQAERLLIEEVKQRPYLWDESMAEHKDMEKARDAWEEIGRNFAMSGLKAKGRWKSMRDIYVRYLRKIALKGGNQPKWKHFEAMSFIADHIKHRRSDLQYPTLRNDMSNGSIGNSKTGQAGANSGFPDVDLDEETNMGGPSKRVTRGRKRKRMEAAAAAAAVSSTAPMKQAPPTAGGSKLISTPSMVHVMRADLGSTSTSLAGNQSQMTIVGTGYVPMASLTSMAGTSGNGNGNRGMNGQETTFTAISIDEDADELFGRAIAATLKKMTPRMKALSKLRIQQVLYELEESSTNTPPPNTIMYKGPPPTNSVKQQPSMHQPPQTFM